MKIGIVTFHRAYNYGAALQACAMKKIFSKYGDCEMVDYWPDYHNSEYSLFDWRFLSTNVPKENRMRLLKSAVKRIILFPIRLKRNRKFRNFLGTHLLSDLSKVIKTADDLPKDFDVFVYGSDQIWRVFNFDNYPCPDMVYMGMGVPDYTKKIAYAASMGDVNNDTLRDDRVIKALNELDHINVREPALKAALHSECAIESEVVLDPTMLVDSSYWRELANSVSKSHGSKRKPYLLFYSLIASPQSSKIARELAEQKGLELVEINGFETIQGALKKDVNQSVGPVEFIELIMNADFMVSTSFHGVVFSIIFEKQFYACGMRGHAERVISLLGQLGIPNRLIERQDEIVVSDTIDYNKVSKLLGEEVDKSYRYIERSLFEGADSQKKG